MNLIQKGDETRCMLQYLGTLQAPVRFDSRILFRQLAGDAKKSHEDWITFVKIWEKQLGQFGKVEVRVSPTNEPFVMLTPMQASLLVLQNVLEQTPSFDTLLDSLGDFYAHLPPDPYAHPFGPGFGLFYGASFDAVQNKTKEEVEQARKQPQRPLEDSEEKIEKALGERLEAQGIRVRYQVLCAYGRADIVTPDAIYEIKRFLTKRALHEAIGQVLAYRASLNPLARAIVVGCQYKGTPVDIQLAWAAGVEVMVWNEEQNSSEV